MSESNDAGASDPALRPTGRDEVIQATLNAAAELFAQQNPSKVSVRQIAACAGVSHALVHRYMGSKEDIFRAALAMAREAAAEYWMHNHGMDTTAGTFEGDLPPGRYVRMVMRASLDDFPLTAADMRFPHADRMLDFLKTYPFPDMSTSPGFDVRVLFSAVTAMAAGMAVAEDFFLVQSGLESEDRDHVRDEFNRLIMRIMSLADRNNA